MKTNKINNLTIIFSLLKPHKKQFFLGLISLLLTAVVIFLFGKALQCLIDFGFAASNQKLLNLSLFAFAILVAMLAIAGYFRSLIANSIAEKVISDLQQKLYRHLLTLSVDFFENKKIGDVISKITVDCNIIFLGVSNNMSFFLRNSIFFVGGVILLFYTSFKLSLLTLLTLPISIFLIIFFAKKVKILANSTSVFEENILSKIEETISGIKVIQSFCNEDNESENFKKLIHQKEVWGLKKIKAKSLMISSIIASSFGSIFFVLWIASNDVLSNKISSGELSSFIFYAVIIATSLSSFSQINAQLQNTAAAISRINQFLSEESNIKTSANPAFIAQNEMIDIVFDQVGFNYSESSDKKILKNISFNIKNGEKIAIVGESGVGKTTIFKLLMRFYDCCEGNIFINSINIKELSIKNLREKFSYIPQNSIIFSDSIFENIRYGNRNITKEEVQNLIDKNSAFNFINNFDQGIDSFVGNKGVKLSAGETQRIALARAIIKDSKIILLDEATSALDNKNEQDIVKIINQVALDKTVIVIAHRLSSIVNCDKIIFIKDGKVAEIGSHQELIALNGYYSEMYNQK